MVSCISVNMQNLWGYGCTPDLDITAPKILALHIWNDICFCLFSSFLVCFSALSLLGFCCSLCHLHFSLQSKYHLKCQRHWIVLCRSQQFVTGTCLLLALFWTELCWACTYHIGMGILLNMMIVCQILGYDHPSLHLLKFLSYIFSFWNMSLTIGPLCICLISAWCDHAGFRHRHILAFGLDPMMKLLHLSAISTIPYGANICCSCNTV